MRILPSARLSLRICFFGLPTRTQILKSDFIALELSNAWKTHYGRGGDIIYGVLPLLSLNVVTRCISVCLFVVKVMA